MASVFHCRIPAGVLQHIPCFLKGGAAKVDIKGIVSGDNHAPGDEIAQFLVPDLRDDDGVVRVKDFAQLFDKQVKRRLVIIQLIGVVAGIGLFPVFAEPADRIMAAKAIVYLIANGVLEQRDRILSRAGTVDDLFQPAGIRHTKVIGSGMTVIVCHQKASLLISGSGRGSSSKQQYQFHKFSGVSY